MEVYAFCAFKSQRPQAVVFAECYVAEPDDGLVLAFADAGGQFALSLAHGLLRAHFCIVDKCRLVSMTEVSVLWCGPSIGRLRHACVGEPLPLMPCAAERPPRAQAAASDEPADGMVARMRRGFKALHTLPLPPTRRTLCLAWSATCVSRIPAATKNSIRSTSTVSVGRRQRPVQGADRRHQGGLQLLQQTRRPHLQWLRRAGRLRLHRLRLAEGRQHHQLFLRAQLPPAAMAHRRQLPQRSATPACPQRRGGPASRGPWVGATTGWHPSTSKG